MKKILTTLACLVGLQGFALADTTNVGIKLSYGNLDASGSETTNAGSTSVVSRSGDADFPFASAFVERDFALANFNIALGLDYVPFKAEIESVPTGTGTGFTADLEDHYTVYIQPSKKLDNGVSLFAKVGYSSADLKISGLQRQATTAGTASTDTGSKQNLEGPMFGLGVEKQFANNAFVRLEVSYTDYDEISYTNSNGKILKASAELTAAHLSIGKKF